MRLWMGETVEWFGGQITILALPTVAILYLNAGPFEMGLLGALNSIGWPILGLFVGVMADRWRRRPMMVWANIGQVLALGSIPLGFMLRLLSLNQLFAVALAMSVTSVFFAIAYQSYLPTLVERDDLVEGNAKLEASSSAALILGPALAGFLIQVTGAAQSIVVDALSTLVAALAILSIKHPEVTLTINIKRDFSKELRDGAEVIFRNPILRTLTAGSATINFGRSMFYAVLFIFIYDQLKITPELAGLVLGIGSVGFLVGALSAPKIVKKLGLGITLALAVLISGTGLFLVPAATYGMAAPTLAAFWMFSNIGMPIWNVNQVSLRQAITSNQLRGRMNATMRTITSGAWSVGALAGGILGATLGIPLTITIGALISTLPTIFIILSPVRKLTEIPIHPISL